MSADPLVVKKVLSEQLHRIKTIGDLARLLGTSPDALRKEFKRREGITLSKYLAEERVAHAKRLLIDSDEECKVICFAVGYSRVDDGMRTFKRHTGFSMEEFRKLNKLH